MTEIVKFLRSRTRKERKGWLNWPVGTPIELGDIGRVSRGIFATEEATGLRDLGITFDVANDPTPDQIDWKYSGDSNLEFFVKGKVNAGGIPNWSSLGAAELGFSAKFGKQGSYRLVVPELRWNRLQMTSDLRRQLKEARRGGRIRRRDRLVVGVAAANRYTLLVSITDNATVEFGADAEFDSIADAKAGFSFRSSKGAVEQYVAANGGVLLLRLAKVRWSRELDLLESAAAEAMTAADGEIHLVESDTTLLHEDDID